MNQNQQNKIIDAVINKIYISQDFEEYIEERMENELCNLMFVQKETDLLVDKEKGNYFKDNL